MAHRYRQGIETKQLLVNTAKELFYCYGYHDVNLSQICKKAGITRSSFFYYFADKADIANFICNNMIDELEQKIRSQLLDEKPDPLLTESVVYLCFYRSLLASTKITRFFSEAQSTRYFYVLGDQLYRKLLRVFSERSPVIKTELDYEMIVLSGMSIPARLMDHVIVTKFNLSTDYLADFIFRAYFVRLAYDLDEIEKLLEDTHKIANIIHVDIEEIYLKPYVEEG